MQKTPVFSKDFILVAIGQIVSIFGNQIVRYALPLYLLNQTGSSLLFGTIMAFTLLPMVLLFPIGGLVADRVNKRNIMVFLDFTTAFLLLLFHLLLKKTDIVPLMAATMVVLYAIQGLYQPAVKASVPLLVAHRHIMKANSVVDVINSAASMAGPVIGGLLFSSFGLTPILYVSIACFFASAVMEMFIHIPFEKAKPNGNIALSALSDLKSSFHFMWKQQPALWKISLLFAASNLLLTSLLLIAPPVIITQHLGFAPYTAGRLYGYLQGAMAAGAVLGGLLAGLLSGKLTANSAPALLIGCCACVVSGGIALQFLHAPMAVYLVLAVSSGLMLALHTLFQIQMMSYLQLLSPHHLMGKIISCFLCVVMCTGPLGQFLYGAVFEHIGNSIFLPFYGAALAMAALTVFSRRIFSGLDNLIQIT